MAKTTAYKLELSKLEKRRSCASMRPRHTVHPVHKKARVLPGGLSTRNDFQINIRLPTPQIWSEHSTRVSP